MSLPSAAEIQAKRTAEGVRPGPGQSPNGQIPTQSPWQKQQQRPEKVFERYQREQLAKKEERDRWLESDEFKQEQKRAQAHLNLRRASGYHDDLEQISDITKMIQELRERMEVDEQRLLKLHYEASSQDDDFCALTEIVQHRMILREIEPLCQAAKQRRQQRIQEWTNHIESLAGDIASDIRSRFVVVQDKRFQELREDISHRAEIAQFPLTEKQLDEQVQADPRALTLAEALSIPSGTDVAEWRACIDAIESLEAPKPAAESTKHHSRSKTIRA
jgi:hypothetical protein